MARSCEQNHRRYTAIRNDIAPKARRFFALISSKPMEIVFFLSVSLLYAIIVSQIWGSVNLQRRLNFKISTPYMVYITLRRRLIIFVNIFT